MEGSINVATVVPKKLKLGDYDLGQTLGTGTDYYKVKVLLEE